MSSSIPVDGWQLGSDNGDNTPSSPPPRRYLGKLPKIPKEKVKCPPELTFLNSGATVRIATFNVENLFARFHFREPLTTTTTSPSCPDPPTDANQKQLCVESLGFTRSDLVFDVHDTMEKKITAEVIKGIDADIIAIQEVESLSLLDRFCSRYLRPCGYRYSMLIDAHDPRGINVAILSRYPIRHVRSYKDEREFDALYELSPPSRIAFYTALNEMGSNVINQTTSGPVSNQHVSTIQPSPHVSPSLSPQQPAIIDPDDSFSLGPPAEDLNNSKTFLQNVIEENSKISNKTPSPQPQRPPAVVTQGLLSDAFPSMNNLNAVTTDDKHHEYLTKRRRIELAVLAAKAKNLQEKQSPKQPAVCTNKLPIINTGGSSPDVDPFDLGGGSAFDEFSDDTLNSESKVLRRRGFSLPSDDGVIYAPQSERGNDDSDCSSSVSSSMKKKPKSSRAERRREQILQRKLSRKKNKGNTRYLSNNDPLAECLISEEEANKVIDNNNTSAMMESLVHDENSPAATPAGPMMMSAREANVFLENLQRDYYKSSPTTPRRRSNATSIVLAPPKLNNQPHSPPPSPYASSSSSSSPPSLVVSPPVSPPPRQSKPPSSQPTQDRQSEQIYLFSRDCLSVEIDVEGVPLFLFVNHFKSMAKGRDATAPKRALQALRVRQILDDRFLKSRYCANVVVLGDFNDYPQNASSLYPLLGSPWLEDIIASRLPRSERWTHHYAAEESYKQLDYMLLSRTLAALNANAPPPQIVREGLPFRASRFEGLRLAGVGDNRPKASDHCAVFMDVLLIKSSAEREAIATSALAAAALNSSGKLPKGLTWEPTVLDRLASLGGSYTVPKRPKISQYMIMGSGAQSKRRLKKLRLGASAVAAAEAYTADKSAPLASTEEREALVAASLDGLLNMDSAVATRTKLLFRSQLVLQSLALEAALDDEESFSFYLWVLEGLQGLWLGLRRLLGSGGSRGIEGYDVDDINNSSNQRYLSYRRRRRSLVREVAAKDREYMAKRMESYGEEGYSSCDQRCSVIRGSLSGLTTAWSRMCARYSLGDGLEVPVRLMGKGLLSHLLSGALVEEVSDWGDVDEYNRVRGRTLDLLWYGCGLAWGGILPRPLWVGILVEEYLSAYEMAFSSVKE